MNRIRRKLLLGTGATLAGTLLAPVVRAQGARRTRLILLGTKGGPRVGAEGRANPANLILIGDTPYVVDCGYGVSRQLERAGVHLTRLRYLFITHHHSDHDLEYGDLFYNAWAAGLKSRVDAWGPPPLAAMTRAYWELNRFDVETRIADEGRPDPRALLVAHEFAASGPVMRNEEVRVSALQVKHPPIVQSYAYRLDAADRSIVLSGDTAYFPPLAEFARGADILVHEAMYAPGVDALVKRVPNGARLKEHLMASHTVTEDVGRIAAAAGVKTVVLSHLVPGDDPSITDAMWAEGVRRHFAGEIIVGRDLLEI